MFGVWGVGGGGGKVGMKGGELATLGRQCL